MSYTLANGTLIGTASLLGVLIAASSVHATGDEGDDDYEVVWIENPESEVLLHARLRYPADYEDGGTYPAVVLVLGGSSNGMSFETNGEAAALSDEGFITMSFSPDGRGDSTNGGTHTEEDYCGYIQQSGLRAVLQYVHDLPASDDDDIGVISRSYGITMAAGALGRFPNDPPVKFLIDWEGPADRSDTASPNGHVEHDITDDEWWYEREPTRHIGGFPGYFQVVQREEDHVQSDNLHAIKLNNAAVGPDGGGTGSALWVRMNAGTGPASNPVNTVYLPPSLPSWHPNTISINAVLRGYAHELVAMDPVALEGDLDGDRRVNGSDLAALLGSWGHCPDCPADLNGDDVVDGADLAGLLGAWTG